MRDQSTHAGKLNHDISPNHRLAFYASVNGYSRTSSPSNMAYEPIPGSASSNWATLNLTGTLIRFTEDWVVTPRLLNHFGIGYNRLLNFSSSTSAGQSWPSKIGLKGVADATFPGISFAGSDLQGGTMPPLGVTSAGGTVDGATIVANDTTWIRSAHNIRFGFEVRKLHSNNRSLGNTTGSFVFNPGQTADPTIVDRTGYSFASFLLGAVYSSTQNIASSTGMRVWYPAFYAGDDWKVTPRLTLNLGLRWEISGAPYEVANRLSNLDPTKPNPGANNAPGALVFLSDLGRKSFMDTTYRGLGPRVGLAYRATTKFVIRAGYGINFQPASVGAGNTYGYSGTNNLNNVFAWQQVLYWDQGYPAFTGTLPDKNPALRNGTSINWYRANDTIRPYFQNWNFGVQWLLGTDTIVDASY